MKIQFKYNLLLSLFDLCGLYAPTHQHSPERNEVRLLALILNFKRIPSF